MTRPIFEWHQMQRAITPYAQVAMYSARADCGQCQEYGFCVFLVMTGTRDKQPGVMPICGACLVAIAPSLPTKSFGMGPTKVILSREERRKMQ